MIIYLHSIIWHAQMPINSNGSTFSIGKHHGLLEVHLFKILVLICFLNCLNNIPRQLRIIDCWVLFYLKFLEREPIFSAYQIVIVTFHVENSLRGRLFHLFSGWHGVHDHEASEYGRWRSTENRLFLNFVCRGHILSRRLTFEIRVAKSGARRKIPWWTIFSRKIKFLRQIMRRSNRSCTAKLRVVFILDLIHGFIPALKHLIIIIVYVIVVRSFRVLSFKDTLAVLEDLIFLIFLFLEYRFLIKLGLDIFQVFV